MDAKRAAGDRRNEKGMCVVVCLCLCVCLCVCVCVCVVCVGVCVCVCVMEQSNIYVCVYIYIDIHTYIYKATRGKEARKGEMEGELKVLIKDAEMDVKLVLEDMWNRSLLTLY